MYILPDEDVPGAKLVPQVIKSYCEGVVTRPVRPATEVNVEVVVLAGWKEVWPVVWFCAVIAETLSFRPTIVEWFCAAAVEVVSFRPATDVRICATVEIVSIRSATVV